jgi:hypothetical protein
MLIELKVELGGLSRNVLMGASVFLLGSNAKLLARGRGKMTSGNMIYMIMMNNPRSLIAKLLVKIFVISFKRKVFNLQLGVEKVLLQTSGIFAKDYQGQ